MTILLYVAPILLVIGLIASGRVTLIGAGLAGLIATLPAVMVALHGTQPLLPFLVDEGLKGAWLAFHSVSVILAGLLLHHAARAAADGGGEDDVGKDDVVLPDDDRHRDAFFYCFIAAGVIECAVGFGIGFAVAIHGLRRRAVPVHAAVALGLISQMLVPWGALAVGTVIGAALAHLPLDGFGLASAGLMPAYLLCLLLWLWGWSWRLGLGLSLRNIAIDIAWTAALAGLLWLGNRYVSVDTAGLVATAPLLALHWLLDRRRPPLQQALPQALRRAAPFLLLIALLLSSRLIAPLGDWLRGRLSWQPWPDMPAFPLLYHGASMLAVTAALYGLVALRRAQWRPLLAQTWRGGRIAMATTLIFLVMARLFAAAGIPAALAAAWQATAGAHALLASPVFAAVAGGLTGGNTASNSLMLPLQAALAQAAGAPVLWISALQSVTSAMFTPFSPGKIALACAFAGWAGGERAAYRAALPLAGLLLLMGLLLAALF